MPGWVKRETHYVLGLIGQLYDIEDEIRLASPDDRLAARQERRVPTIYRDLRYHLLTKHTRAFTLVLGRFRGRLEPKSVGDRQITPSAVLGIPQGRF